MERGTLPKIGANQTESPNPEPPGTSASREGDNAAPLFSKRWLPALLLAAAVILAYQPVWHGGFIWDDDVYVTKNKLLTAPDGLKRIWFSQDSPSQYFPLVYTTFRFEHALWGLNPAGYHGVNILLHALNALLVWRLLRRLSVPGSWLGAALFALHPVQVETVAWVTERKNLLSFAFYLLSLLAWVEFADENSAGGFFTNILRRLFRRTSEPTSPAKPCWGLYSLALLFYLLALLSKTTACTLPVAMLLVLWLKRWPITAQRLAQVTPFAVLGLGFGLLTMWWERHHIGTSGGVFTIGPLERLLIASRAVWFYLGKLLWPMHLTFSYPRWDIKPNDLLAYSGLVAGICFCVWVWIVRRVVGRGVEVASAFFVATLAPTLGFIMLFTFRYTYVADHYQYAACLGPLALAAAGFCRAHGRLSLPGRFLWPAFCALMVAVLGTLTFHQAGVYQTAEKLWRDTIAKNPDSWMAHGNLGRDLMHEGRYDEAMAQYKESLRINPRDVDSLVSVGNALFGKGRHDEALGYYQRALVENPDNPEAHVNMAVILANRGQIDDAIKHEQKALEVNPQQLTARVNLGVLLARQKRFEEALEQYKLALAINPDQPLTHINLAIALAALGRTAEAEEHYRIAALAVNKHAQGLVEQGRLDEAEAQYREAIRMIPNNAEAYFRLGFVHVRQGKTAQAREDFVQALRLKPDYAEAKAQLRALDRAGQ